MKTLTLLILICTCSACATFPADFNKVNTHAADAKAIRLLKSAGFYPPAEKPTVYLYPNRYCMQAKLDLYEPFIGWYDPARKSIHLVSNAPFKIAVEEYMHYYLHMVGILIHLHHGKIHRLL